MSLNWSKFELRHYCVFTICLMINLQISLALFGVFCILPFLFIRCVIIKFTSVCFSISVFLKLWYIFNHKLVLIILCVCWLCITQFSWTITLSKAWFGICCHTQARTVIMTRSNILLVWTWELVMFISWITQHTLCKCAVLWIIVRLNVLTLCGFG